MKSVTLMDYLSLAILILDRSQLIAYTISSLFFTKIYNLYYMQNNKMVYNNYNYELHHKITEKGSHMVIEPFVTSIYMYT